MKLRSLEELSPLRNNSVEYQGELDNYQNDGSRGKYQQLRLTPYQNLLYKRALYGLSEYSEKEVKKMHWEKKKRIQKINQKAQSSINLFKQETVNKLCNAIYDACFKGNSIARLLLSDQEVKTDSRYINTLDLKDLGITKKDIIDRFICEGILPKDFYELKEAV